MSTLSVNTITAETGNTVSVASGKTLNASQGFTPPAGHVIQTITTGTIARNTISATAWTNTTYTLSITPSSTSSKIFFQWNNHVRVQGETAQIRGGVRLKRTIGSTDTMYGMPKAQLKPFKLEMQQMSMTQQDMCKC